MYTVYVYTKKIYMYILRKYIQYVYYICITKNSKYIQWRLRIYIYIYSIYIVHMYKYIQYVYYICIYYE